MHNLGIILWLIICISLNGLVGWIVTAVLSVSGFLWPFIEEEWKNRKNKEEQDNVE